jgi:hypothetical protein
MATAIHIWWSEVIAMVIKKKICWHDIIKNSLIYVSKKSYWYYLKFLIGKLNLQLPQTKCCKFKLCVHNKIRKNSIHHALHFFLSAILNSFLIIFRHLKIWFRFSKILQFRTYIFLCIPDLQTSSIHLIFPLKISNNINNSFSRRKFKMADKKKCNAWWIEFFLILLCTQSLNLQHLVCGSCKSRWRKQVVSSGTPVSSTYCTWHIRSSESVLLTPKE